MRRFSLLFASVAVALLVLATVCHRGNALAEQGAGEPTIIRDLPTGLYDMKLTDGTTISAIKKVHVVSYQGIRLYMVTTVDGDKSKDVFVNPVQVVTLNRLGK